jgi:hypothetical protein
MKITNTAMELTKKERKSAILQTAMSNFAQVPVRVRLARLIMIYQFVLIILAATYYALTGFDGEEFTSLMAVLTPVTALYGGAVFRYLGRTLKAEPEKANDLPSAQVGWVRWLVHLHFGVILVLISSKALFNWINFQMMLTLMAAFEASFGGYMGFILSALFGEEKKE